MYLDTKEHTSVKSFGGLVRALKKMFVPRSQTPEFEKLTKVVIIDMLNYDEDAFG